MHEIFGKKMCILLRISGSIRSYLLSPHVCILAYYYPATYPRICSPTSVCGVSQVFWVSLLVFPSNNRIWWLMTSEMISKHLLYISIFKLDFTKWLKFFPPAPSTTAQQNQHAYRPLYFAEFNCHLNITSNSLTLLLLPTIKSHYLTIHIFHSLNCSFS